MRYLRSFMDVLPLRMEEAQMTNDSARELLREASDMLACSYSGFADDASESVRYAKLRDDLLARITALLSENADGWMPIESAPRDRTEILAFNGEIHKMKWIEGDGYALFSYSEEVLADVDPDPEQPTHWQPLPTPPKNGGK